MPRKYKWVVEIEVADTWVADGFDLDDDRAHKMLAEHLPYAYGHELKARVLKAPDPDAIAKEQGYSCAAQREIVTRKP